MLAPQLATQISVGLHAFVHTDNGSPRESSVVAGGGGRGRGSSLKRSLNAKLFTLGVTHRQQVFIPSEILAARRTSETMPVNL